MKTIAARFAAACFGLTKSAQFDQSSHSDPVTVADIVRLRMDANDINAEQAARLCKSLRPPLRYLGKLRRRMELLGFPPSDPLYLATSAAHDALQALHVHAHYCSCPTGVAKMFQSQMNAEHG